MTKRDIELFALWQKDVLLNKPEMSAQEKCLFIAGAESVFSFVLHSQVKEMFNHERD